MIGSVESSPPPPRSEARQSQSPPEVVAHKIDEDGVDGHLDLGFDMAIVPPTSAPPSPPPEEEDDEEEEEEAGEEPKPLPNPSRRAHGRKSKTKPLTPKQRAVAEEKLRVLANLDCQPFVPTSVDVDVSKHERVLRLLGLWDFVNLKLDQEIRKDLIVEFIAYYDHNRRTCVKNMRIVGGRMPLARALRLPERKAHSSESEESDRGLFEDQATKAALVKFLLGWVVLVGEVGIVPDEGQAAIMKIESGQPNKVDWAGLLWGMVHREILDACKSGVCCYASHLQTLMRYQKPMLFEVEPPREVPVDEEEGEDAAMLEAVCVEKGGNAGNAEPEKVEKEFFHATTSGLASGDSGNFEQARQQQWFLGRRNEVDEHCLRPCSTNIVQNMEFDVDADEGEHEMDNHGTCEDDFTSKFPNLANSADLLQGMNTDNVSFVPTVQQPLDPSPGEFLASPIEVCKNVAVNSTAASSSLFGHVGRRPPSKIDGDEEDSDDDNQNFSQGNIAKRLRYDESWDHSSSACMEQAINWLEKARLVSTQKEQAAMDTQIQLQYLNDLVQKKDQIIQSLERSRLEDQHMMQLKFTQFEHERTVMSHMVFGYQKALRRTRQTFAEYGKKFPQCVEPLYMDVPGSSGLVLTVREIERQRLEKLESEKLILEKKVLDYNKIIRMLLNFSREWSEKFETHEDQVCQLAKRVDVLFGEMELLKVHNVENKCSDGTKLFKDHPVENKHLCEMKLLKDHIVENECSGEMKLLKADIVDNKQSDEMVLEKDHIMEDEHAEKLKFLGDQIMEKDRLDERYSVDADS